MSSYIKWRSLLKITNNQATHLLCVFILRMLYEIAPTYLFIHPILMHSRVCISQSSVVALHAKVQVPCRANTARQATIHTHSQTWVGSQPNLRYLELKKNMNPQPSVRLMPQPPYLCLHNSTYAYVINPSRITWSFFFTSFYKKLWWKLQHFCGVFLWLHCGRKWSFHFLHVT